MTEEQKQYIWANFADNPELLRFLADDCLSGIWFRDLTQAGAARLSDGFWLTLGYQVDDIPVDPLAWRSLTQPDDLALLDANMARHCREPQFLIDRIVRYRHLDGNTVWMRCRGMAIRDTDGRVMGLAGTHSNLTDVKRKEMLLDTCNRIARIGYWEVDLLKSKVLWSAVTSDIHGLGESACQMTIDEGTAYYHPEDRAAVRELMNNAIANGREYDAEARIIRTDSTERYVRILGFPDYIDGHCVHLYGTIQDIDEQRRNSLALQLNEEKFRGIFHSTFSFIGLLRPDGILIEANETALAMAGLKPADVIGKPFWDCYWWQISPATQDELRKNVKRAAAGEESTYEVAVWIDNNKPITILFSLRPIFDSEGRVVYIVPEGRPIQEQVDARFRYEAILNGTNVGTWEWNVQSGDTRFNDRWAEIIGYRLEELGLTTIETWMRFAHPDDLAGSNAALQACFDGDAEFYEVEARMRHRDGHWVWVLDRGKVFSWDSDGKPLMMYGTHQDISERKRREEQLRQSEEAFRNNFHHAGIGMALVGVQGEWLMVNRRLCEFLGYGEDELLRLTFQDITHPDDLDKDLALLQEVIDRHREHYQIEKRYLHKAGHVVHALLAVSVVRNEDGSVCNFISQIVDITAQRQAQDHVASLLKLANEQNRELQSLQQQLEVANSALREESLTDPLTGLPNRRVMEKALNDEISRVERGASGTLTLALIDVDSFKSFNDSFGHPAGDDLLLALGQVLISAIRPYDSVARIGGEEFAILLADTPIDEAFSIIERLRSTVEQTSWPHRAITISAGLYSWRDGMSKEALVEAADQRLYAAKRGGRNRVVADAVSRDQ
ncbi:MAG: PAS domain-containing protein [Pseudomonadota bacterium]